MQPTYLNSELPNDVLPPKPMPMRGMDRLVGGILLMLGAIVLLIAIATGMARIDQFTSFPSQSERAPSDNASSREKPLDFVSPDDADR